MEIDAEAYHEQQEKEECVICLDEVETEWRELACHHRYHTQCIENWIAVSAKCPLCMKYIKDNKPEEVHVNNSIIEEIHYIAIRRFMLFILLVVCVIIVMVLCSQ